MPSATPKSAKSGKMASASSLFLRTLPTSLLPANSTRKSKRGIGTATTSHYTRMPGNSLQELPRGVGEPGQEAMSERLRFPGGERQFFGVFEVSFERGARHPRDGRVVDGNVAFAVVPPRARIEVVGTDGDHRLVENGRFGVQDAPLVGEDAHLVLQEAPDDGAHC